MNQLNSHDGINKGVAPVTYGAGERPPRGDYHLASADYTCTQRVEDYTLEEHDRYKRLCERQIHQVKHDACDEFIACLNMLGDREHIPSFSQISEKLYHATAWQIVAVPGLIPEEAFFALLAARKFPVTNWLRHEDEFDYVVEPDLFHDFFGHVPLLFNPVFADYMQKYGENGIKAHKQGTCEFLARLYWYTVEFGLIKNKHGIKAYGAGIISSPGELHYSVSSAKSRRVMFELERVMRTNYKIDTFQETYFVIDSFENLFEKTNCDLSLVLNDMKTARAINANGIDEADMVIHI